MSFSAPARFAGEATGVSPADLYASASTAEGGAPRSSGDAAEGSVRPGAGPNCPCPQPGQSERCGKWPCVFAGGIAPFNGQTPQLPV